LIFELLLGTGGRRSEVEGMMVGNVDFSAKRAWVRQPVVEVEGRLVRNLTPKGGRRRAVAVGSQLAQLLREHLMRMGMPPADAPFLMSATGDGLQWNNYLARRLRPQIRATAARWAVGRGTETTPRRRSESSAGYS
jgi:integrase